MRDTLERVLDSLGRVHGSLDFLAKLILARRRGGDDGRWSEGIPPSSRRLK
jgi:hypothetical protein